MPLFLTVPEVADTLGLNRKTVLNLARDGEIPSVRIGRKYLVSRSWLDEVIARTAA